MNDGKRLIKTKAPTANIRQKEKQKEIRERDGTCVCTEGRLTGGYRDDTKSSTDGLTASISST